MDIIFTDFCHAHAPNLVQLDNGVILLMFHGRKNRNETQSLYLARYENGWTEPCKINLNTKSKLFNPVFYKHNKEIWAFIKVGSNPDSWQGAVIISRNGHEWTELLSLPANILGSTKNPPLTLPNGQILMGSSREHRYHFPVMEIFNVETGDIKTISLEQSLTSPEFRVIQPSLVQLKGEILGLFRTNKKYIFSATSRDGENWSPLKATQYPNPNSAITTLTTENGYYLALNTSAYNRRVLAVIFCSPEKEDVLVTKISHEHNKEVSYPSLIFQGSYLVIAYSINQKEIGVKRIKRID